MKVPTTSLQKKHFSIEAAQMGDRTSVARFRCSVISRHGLPASKDSMNINPIFEVLISMLNMHACLSLMVRWSIATH